MSIINLDGFKLFDEQSGKILILESERIPESMVFLKKNKLKGVAISKYHGYNLKNIDFLKDNLQITHISISEDIKNIDGLKYLTDLEFLMISGKNRKIDFSVFRKLKNLSIDWSPSFININLCHTLITLNIYKYNALNQDLSSIDLPRKLENLTINQSTIESTEGISVNLKRLEFNYCPKLIRIEGLNNSLLTLSELRFLKCKSIINHSFVKKFSNLKTLIFTDCGNIPSIEFLDQMPKLEKFTFVDTNILDGNLNSLIKLKFAGFIDKRHYNRTYKELAKIHGHFIE